MPAYLTRQDEPWWHSFGFIGLTRLIAGLPFPTLLLMGRRAETVLVGGALASGLPAPSFPLDDPAFQLWAERPIDLSRLKGNPL